MACLEHLGLWSRTLPKDVQSPKAKRASTHCYASMQERVLFQRVQIPHPPLTGGQQHCLGERVRVALLQA